VNADELTEDQKNSLRGHGLLDDGIPYKPLPTETAWRLAQERAVRVVEAENARLAAQLAEAEAADREAIREVDRLAAELAGIYNVWLAVCEEKKIAERERDRLAADLAEANEGFAEVEAAATRALRQVDQLRDALPEDTPELRHWLGSQDVIGDKTSTQIAGFVHAGMRFRAALSGVSGGEGGQ
jgi:hypothetical protein